MCWHTLCCSVSKCACSTHYCASCVYKLAHSTVTLHNVCYSQLALTMSMQCVAVCCSVLQCVAVCCSVLQCPPNPNPPNPETQSPRCKFKLNQTPNLKLYREIPRNLSLSIWWMSGMLYFQWKLSHKELTMYNV